MAAVTEAVIGEVREVEAALSVALDVSGLDASFKEHAARGIGRYVQALRDFLVPRTDSSLTITTFDHRELAPTPLMNSVLQWCPAGRNTIRQQVLYPLRLSNLRRRGINVLHFPAHMDPPAWSPIPYIVSVMDLIPLVLSDLYKADRPGWRFRLARYFEMKAICSAALVLTISEQTAADVHRLLQVPRERIVVTPLGVEEKFFGAALHEDEALFRGRLRIPLNRPIILYVGGIDQRKNCRGLLETVRRVQTARRERAESEPVLVMAGKISEDRQYPKLLELVKRLDLERDVCLTGYLSDQDLLQLYAMSSVFLFLSLYEGFGLPPLEALAAGVPVVSSNRSAMPEVLGKAAVLVDPEDYQETSKAVLDLLDRKETVARIRDQGVRQARRFTWERTAELTFQAYQRFLTR